MLMYCIGVMYHKRKMINFAVGEYHISAVNQYVRFMATMGGILIVGGKKCI